MTYNAYFLVLPHYSDSITQIGKKEFYLLVSLQMNFTVYIRLFWQLLGCDHVSKPSVESDIYSYLLPTGLSSSHVFFVCFTLFRVFCCCVCFVYFFVCLRDAIVCVYRLSCVLCFVVSLTLVLSINYLLINIKKLKICCL